MAMHMLDAEDAAKFLTQEAYRRGSADNITCVVVRFKHGGQEGMAGGPGVAGPGVGAGGGGAEQQGDGALPQGQEGEESSDLQ